MRRDKPREDVAEMLRQGAPYRVIEQELGASRHVITATRQAYRIPLPKGPGYRLSSEQREVVEKQVAELLSDHASYREIREEVGISYPTIQRIRTRLGLPVGGGRDRPRPRTVAQTFELYTEPFGEGHLRWTGPRRGRSALLFAEGRRFNARHVAFEAYRGRPPVGYVRSSCRQIPCMEGAHLVDAVLRGTASPSCQQPGDGA
ncbi:hypothetical protein [Streptomyces sp. NPDC047453]|uniref:hypothetical protein n=1 Tax=Streptomyces sp. NPDC047453 TaxID=3154812 RepID=UPI0033CF1666